MNTKNIRGVFIGMHMSSEQTGEIRGAASMAMIKLTSIVGYPTLVDLAAIDAVLDELNKIKAIVYELDAKCSHDNSTAIADNDSGLKEAA